MLDDEALLRARIELWKQAIEVQKHFNDIGMRIRGLGLTVLTFALGGATFAIKEEATFAIFSHRIQAGAAFLLSGLILWLVFYFVDQIWYHRLLVGAVKHGHQLEERIRDDIPEAGLTIAISENSPYRLRAPWPFRRYHYDIHSRQKIRLYYLAVSAILAVLLILIQFGTG
jgi:hypothetical protein